MESFSYQDLGRIAYSLALDKQNENFHQLLTYKEDGLKGENKLLFCEHDPVFTIGKSGKDSNLLVPELLLQQKGITLFHIDRGGDITYHGPGQITGYPIFDLDQFGIGLKKYVHTVEDIVIEFLSQYNIQAERLDGATGVWIDANVAGSARKICAIGVKSSRFVTMHGFALNINTDMDYYSLINPCGFVDKGVTSLEKELGEKQDFNLAKNRLLTLFKQAFR
nr:lipoyl(octanoyl) transferase LipB [uncultured Macellibacteroides sp.]